MSYYFAAAIAIAAIVGHGSARVAALSAADEARIEQMLWDQQTQLYEAGRHDGGPYESDIAVLVKNPFGDSRDLLSIGGFVESDTCWLHLSTSDLDASKAVTGEEYVGFCKLLVPDILSDAVTTFQDLPPVYRDAFEATACLCQNPLAGGNPDDVNCCSRDDENDNSNPGDGNSIRIPVQPSNSPNATEINYLYTVCSLAEAAAERYINSAAPTTSPDVVGTTESPVGAPNVSPPISSPTTSGVTEAPSMEATPFPTVSPTDSKATSIAPSPIDVLAPTATPSVVPSTSAPATSSLGSSLPSLAPVTGGAPTQDPAEILTTSAAPVGFPVPSVPFSPTSAPVGFPVPSVPSIPSPTQDPADISTPTTAPIVQGPSVPTVAPSTVEATVSYDISLRDGQEQIKSNVFVTEYLSNLIVAMDTLAIETAEALERRLLQQTDQGFRSRNLRRSSSFVRLLSSSVEVTLPTSNEVIDDILCPLVSNVALPNSTVCQRIDALIRLNVLNGTSETAESNFVAGVRRAIVNGQLQSQLDSLAWETVDGGNPVMVLTGLDLSPSPVPSQDGSRDDFESENNPLSAAQIFGISLAGLVLALVPVSVFLMQRRRGSGDDAEVFNEDKKVFREIEAEDAEEDISSSKPDVSDVNKSDAGEATPTLGASQAYYGKGGHEAGMLLDDDDDDDDGAASSNAGSSGWSSSAGISSLNTGSVDDAVDIAAAAGATLAGLGVAGLGVASGYSRNLRNKVETPSDTDDGHSDIPSASRDQLDSLIESGDWAAVGATAALLAAASDSQSSATMSRASGSHGRSKDSQSVDAARAAELDHLVDAGDWEGVVAAAAKFEAQAESGTASRSSKTNSSVESSGGSGSNTGTNTAGSPSVTTSISDTQSKAQKREEARSEVEALVRRVVPEEIDNVDEMMNQFKGREEELVETLRTMQERAVAQKARAAGHRAAKTEARRSVQRGGSGGISSGAVVQKVASLEIKEAASGSGGLTAAGAGISSAAAASVGVAVVVAGVAAGMDSQPKSNKDDSKVSASQAENVAEQNAVVGNARSALEEAIEAGDWDAVGEAAALISDNSVTTASSGEIARLAGTSLSVSTLGSNRSRQLSGVNAERASELDAMIDRGDWSGVVAVANRFSESDKSEVGVRSQEEEDALKEAELWMQIAEQKKAEGAMDAGASDAAEWAIQRSLSQLKDAEKQSTKKIGNDDDEEV